MKKKVLNSKHKICKYFITKIITKYFILYIDITKDTHKMNRF